MTFTLRIIQTLRPALFFKRTVSSCEVIKLRDKDYQQDSWTNIKPKTISYIDKQLHLRDHHPLCLMKQRIVKYFQNRYVNRRGNPHFSVYDQLSPIVSVEQNFDSLLVGQDHPSRARAESYYINRHYLLRAHMTAHDRDLIKSGLDNFLTVGDVYRRDDIDSCHFPVFHQMDGVRLVDDHQLFRDVVNGNSLSLLEKASNLNQRTDQKQESHSMEAVKLMEHDLKTCLVGLVQDLFGKDIAYKWTDTFFPFTHPSWELEILFEDVWMEILGCGILEHGILVNAGAGNKIGWAFGLGLERLAMKVYSIPDIRLFWSNDPSFMWQFRDADPFTAVQFQAISKFPEYYNDISFWIPEGYDCRNFFELVRDHGGDLVQRVELLDEFTHPKTQRRSHCYRIVYRHMERTLSQEEVGNVHGKISTVATEDLKVEIR